jgi:hypothetical protein
MDRNDRTHLLTLIKDILNHNVARGASEGEAATAMAVAQRLMDKHNIALAEVVSHSADDSMFDQAVAWTSDTAHSHFVSAIPVVEKVFAVKAVVKRLVYPGGKTAQVNIVLFGDPSNIDTARWALNFLGATFRRLWDAYRIRTKAKTAEMQGYYFGLVDGFLGKLDEHRADLERTQIGATNALALLSNRLDQAFSSAFPQAGKLIKKSSGSSEAYSDGCRDGRDINLARPLDNSDRRSLEGSRRALPAR